MSGCGCQGGCGGSGGCGCGDVRAQPGRPVTSLMAWRKAGRSALLTPNESSKGAIGGGGGTILSPKGPTLGEYFSNGGGTYVSSTRTARPIGPWFG